MKHLYVCNWIRRINLPEPEDHLYNLHQPFSRIINKAHQVRNAILFTSILLGFGQVCWGQVNFFYKSNPTVLYNYWNNSANWLSSASLTGTYATATIAPGVTNDVVIQGGHTISLSGDASVNNITISANSTLKASSKILSVYGNFINNGNFYLSSNTIAMVGSVPQNIGGSKNTTFNILTISNAIPTGVTANTSFSIASAFTINASCIFNPSPNIVVTGQPSSKIDGEGAVKVTCTTGGFGDYTNQYPLFSNNSVKTIHYVGSSEQVVTPGQTLRNIQIDNLYGCILKGDAILSENLNILSGTLYVKPGANLSVNGTTTLGSAECLVLQSDSTEADGELTGSFKHSDIFRESGTIKVQRFMSHSNNWHLYCSPIGYTSTTRSSQVSIHNFLMNNLEIPYLENTDSVGMRDYNTAEDKWKLLFVYKNGISDAPPGDMEIGKGFSIRTSYNLKSPTNVTVFGSGLIDAVGIPNRNTVAVTMRRSATLKDQGWNCIGNPFTSAISIPGFLGYGENLANLDAGFGAIYVWDTNGITKTTPGFLPVGEYIALNSSGGEVDVNSVQIGQGFFVKSISDGAVVKFDSTMQIPDAALTFKSARPNWPTIVLRVLSPALSSLSSTRIKFITNTTKGLDPGYDAGMLKANPDFALYSKLLVDNAVDFTIQCLPDQNYDQYVIPIGMDCKVAGDVTFTAETINLPSGCQALLEDRLTKRFTRLDLKDAKYTAAVSADTKGTGRFYLHTSDVISSDIPLENQPFKVYETGKTVYINGEVSKNAKFFVYSANGKLLANFLAESQVQNQFSVSGFPAGVYILTVDDKNQKKSVKFLIEN